MPAHNEMLRPTFATKACLLASIVFAFNKQSYYITTPHDVVYLVCTSHTKYLLNGHLTQ